MMNQKLFYSTLLAALTFVPVGAFGESRACTASSPAEASDRGNLQKEAANLFDGLASRAAQTVNDASELSAYQRANQISYWSQAFRLEAIRENVNGMGEEMCRLEEMRSALPASRQSEIRDLEATLNQLAHHTRVATRFAGNNQDYLWAPAYGQWVNALYSDAEQMSRTLGRYEKYAGRHGTGAAAGQ